MIFDFNLFLLFKNLNHQEPVVIIDDTSTQLKEIKEIIDSPFENVKNKKVKLGVDKPKNLIHKKLAYILKNNLEVESDSESEGNGDLNYDSLTKMMGAINEGTYESKKKKKQFSHYLFFGTNLCLFLFLFLFLLLFFHYYY